jgi:N utilization substance protein A
MKSDFSIAITQLAAERKLPKERVLAAIEAALASAYKKDNDDTDDIVVRLNSATGEVQAFALKTVSEQVEDSHRELSLNEARRFKADAEIGDVIEIEMGPQRSGRIIAQTAKQVVMQRLREAERELVFEEYAQREGEMVMGTLQRVDRTSEDRGTFIVDLDRTEAIFPVNEQVEFERYRSGQKMKFLILEVRRTMKGPEIVLSRTHKSLLRRLFELEVPEIYNGIVQIKAIAREPGSRSKIAVVARQDGVDPVGSCVGLRGIRIQNIVNELQGEKIDVIQWHPVQGNFIANSLSPAQPLRVDVNEESLSAVVIVPDKQFSLAIGREGQNARLTAKLSGLKIDIKSASDAEAERLKQSLEGRPIAAARAAAQAAELDQDIVEEAPVEGPEEVLVAEITEQPVESLEVEEVVSEIQETETQKLDRLGLSPEEELLALEDASTLTSETEEKVEDAEEESDELGEEIWIVPEATSSQGPQIRFAEDIMGPWGPGGRDGKKGRRKGKRGGGGSAKPGRKPSSGKTTPSSGKTTPS